jgi:hypothetical protein
LAAKPHRGPAAIKNSKNNAANGSFILRIININSPGLDAMMA